MPLQDLLLSEARINPGKSISVIVQAVGPAEPVMAAVSRIGGRVTHQWSVINGFAVQLPASRLWRLTSQPGVRWISLDGAMQATGKEAHGSNLTSAYPFAVTAADVWNAGMTGSGVTVAIVDSGIDHGAGAGLQDLGRRVIYDSTFNSEARYQADWFGHDTHVAGIVAGSGGKYMGIAPGADLLNLKFSSDDGMGTTSDLLSALVERLWAEGIVVVVSAGNRGSSADAEYYPPANDPYVITVGAADDRGTPEPGDDFMASWSSRGITQDQHSKPDILASGAHIVSIKAGNSAVLVSANPNNIVDNNYFRLGGTSMATPVVTGAVALMLEKDPGLTPDQVKWVIMNTGRTWQGMEQSEPGMLDAYAATIYSASQTPASANTSLTPSAGGGGGTGTDSNVHWLTSADY